MAVNTINEELYSQITSDSFKQAMKSHIRKACSEYFDYETIHYEYMYQQCIKLYESINIFHCDYDVNNIIIVCMKAIPYYQYPTFTWSADMNKSFQEVAFKEISNYLSHSVYRTMKAMNQIPRNYFEERRKVFQTM